MPNPPETPVKDLPRCGACNQLLCEECWHGDIGPGGEINRCQECVMKERLVIDVSAATGCPKFESDGVVKFGNGPVKKSRGHANIITNAILIGWRAVKPAPQVNLYIKVQLPEWPIKKGSVEINGLGPLDASQVGVDGVFFRATVDYKNGTVEILTTADLHPGCDITYYAK